MVASYCEVLVRNLSGGSCSGDGEAMGRKGELEVEMMMAIALSYMIPTEESQLCWGDEHV